jgi:hypothetical protein
LLSSKRPSSSRLILCSFLFMFLLLTFSFSYFSFRHSPFLYPLRLRTFSIWYFQRQMCVQSREGF